MTTNEVKDIAEYLKEKKVFFAIKCDHINKTVSLFGIKIEKKGKFFRGNGVIIAGNIAKLLIN